MLNEQDVTNKRSYITQIFSAAFIVIGVVYFEYMSRLFVERGIYADEHQTSGYTTMLEFLGLFGSAALIIFGLTVFFVVWRQRVVKNKSTQSLQLGGVIIGESFAMALFLFIIYCFYPVIAIAICSACLFLKKQP